MSFAFSLPRFARLSCAAALLSLGLSLPALADSVDGTISKIDKDTNTVTLENGKSYNLPGEFDFSGFRAGQEVTLFYDTDPSGAYVTDIEVQGEKAPDMEDSPKDDGGEDDDTGGE